MKDIFTKNTQPGGGNFKEVSILVTKPTEPKARVRVRDEIVKTAKKMGAKVIDCEPKLNCALIACDDDIRDRLKQRFPEVTIADNIGGYKPAQGGPTGPGGPSA